MANSILCLFLLVLFHFLTAQSGITQKILTAIDNNNNNYTFIGSISPGQSITIYCPLTENTKWARIGYMDGDKTVFLYSKDNINIDNNQLKINDIDFKDSGIYYCEHNVASYRFYLYVFAITKTTNGTVPMISTSNEFNGIYFNQTKMNERASANVSCFCENGTNNTKINIIWKGGLYDKWSDLYAIGTSSPGTGIISTLTLKNAANNKNLYGEYTCSCNVVSDTTIESKVYMEVPPMFDEFVQSRRTVEGEDITLTCNVWGYPAVVNSSIHWTFQNNIKLRDGIVVLTNDSLTGYRQLFIPKVTNADRGVYTCHATNAAGSNSATTMLRVKGRYAALWPFIGIIIQLVILIAIIVVYEWKKSQKSKAEGTKCIFDSKNDPDTAATERGNEPESVRQRLVKA